MLVLSRKADQKISIGDDITLTVVRIDGNRVRIGIDAPQDVRILRGELSATAADETSEEYELSVGEMPFAHPQPSRRRPSSPANRVLAAAEPRVFSGTVSRGGETVQLTSAEEAAVKVAPLAEFVSAS